MLPGIVIRRLPCSINPGVKKTVQIHARDSFTNRLKISGARCTITPFRVQGVCAQNVKKCRISNHMPQHVQHPGAFIVHDAIEQAVHICCILPKDRAVPVLYALVHVLLVACPPIPVLAIERDAVRCKAFIEPDVAPRPHGDHISPPLVCQLVGCQGFAEPFLAADGLVFHAAAPVELGDAVFFPEKRVRPENLMKIREHIRQAFQLIHRLIVH